MYDAIVTSSFLMSFDKNLIDVSVRYLVSSERRTDFNVILTSPSCFFLIYFIIFTKTFWDVWSKMLIAFTVFLFS